MDANLNRFITESLEKAGKLILDAAEHITKGMKTVIDEPVNPELIELQLGGIYRNVNHELVKIIKTHSGPLPGCHIVFIGDNGSKYSGDGKGMCFVPRFDRVLNEGLGFHPDLVEEIKAPDGVHQQETEDLLALEKGGSYCTVSGVVVTITALRHPRGSKDPIFVGDNGGVYNERGRMLPTKDGTTDHITSKHTPPETAGMYRYAMGERRHKWMVIHVTKVESGDTPSDSPKLATFIVDQQKYRNYFLTVDEGYWSRTKAVKPHAYEVTPNGIIYQSFGMTLKEGWIYLSKDGQFVKIISSHLNACNPSTSMRFIDNLGNVYNEQGSRMDNKALNGDRNLVVEVCQE